MTPDQALQSPPVFSLAERDRRHAAVREKMRERDLAVLVFPHATGEWDNFQPGTRYLACVGGGGMATSLVFPLEGETTVAVRDARRIGWARDSQKWIADVRSPPEGDWARFVVERIEELGLTSERIGVVGLYEVVREPAGLIVYNEFVNLQKRLPKAHFVSATSIVDAVRKRKSAEEIRMIERAQICADAISECFRTVARPGLWCHELVAEILAAGIRVGCEMPSMFLLGCAPTMSETQVDVAFRRVDENDILLLEAEPKFFGYAAQAIQTLGMRRLTQEEEGLLQTSQACFEVLLDAMKPGRSYLDLIDLWHKTAARDGRVAARTMGHGIGLGQDLPWTSGSGLVAQSDMMIEVGDCFILKPLIANAAGKASGRVGAPVVVDDAGARRLNAVDIAPIQNVARRGNGH